MPRVLTDTGKFWNLKGTFSRPGKSWNLAYVLESHGIGPTSWKVLEKQIAGVTVFFSVIPLNDY